MTGEQIIEMTRRVSLFYGWGYNCRKSKVETFMAEHVLFNRPSSHQIDNPVPRAANVYEIEAFWNGYQNGTDETYYATIGDQSGQGYYRAHRQGSGD